MSPNQPKDETATRSRKRTPAYPEAYRRDSVAAWRQSGQSVPGAKGGQTLHFSIDGGSGREVGCESALIVQSAKFDPFLESLIVQSAKLDPFLESLFRVRCALRRSRTLRVGLHLGMIIGITVAGGGDASPITLRRFSVTALPTASSSQMVTKLPSAEYFTKYLPGLSIAFSVIAPDQIFLPPSSRVFLL